MSLTKEKEKMIAEEEPSSGCSASDLKEGDSTPKLNENQSPAKDAGKNPSVAEGTEAEVDMVALRGDAIADTMYSSSFVLSTLLKVLQLKTPIGHDKQLETDLCSVWDMSVEESVTKFLLSQDVLELFGDAIGKSTDARLVEILVGIVGNMASCPEVRDRIRNTGIIYVNLLPIIRCLDTPTLVQYMRLLSVLVGVTDEDEAVSRQWFEHFDHIIDFAESFEYILKNSENPDLLLATLHALNTLLAKFVGGLSSSVVLWRCFKEEYCRPSLMIATSAAFETLMNMELLEVERFRHGVKMFLNIHCIMANCSDILEDAYRAESMTRLLDTLIIVMKIVGYSSEKFALISAETLCEILTSLGHPFTTLLFLQLLDIWEFSTAQLQRARRVEVGAEHKKEMEERTKNYNELLTGYVHNTGMDDLIQSVENKKTKHFRLLHKFLTESNTKESDPRLEKLIKDLEEKTPAESQIPDSSAFH